MITEPYTLTDRQGVEHTYHTKPHGTSEGVRLVLALLAAASGPLVQVMLAMFARGPGSDPTTALADAVGNLDDAAVSADLRAALTGLDPGLVLLLFKHTLRDGKSLSNQAVLDSAYAGNWAEFFSALLRIEGVNGFVPFAASSATTTPGPASP